MTPEIRAQAAELARTDPQFEKYCRVSHEAKLAYLLLGAGYQSLPESAQAALCMFQRADRIAWHNECCFLIQYAVRNFLYYPH